MSKLTILEPLQRIEIITEIQLKTNFSEQYLRELSDEELLKIQKERC